MGTTLNTQCWSTTAASNDGVDAGIGTVADSSAPNTVDNWARGIMAAVRKYAIDVGGGPTVGGTADVITITTNQAISSAHQAAGFSLRFKAGGTNTGAVTVNVDTIGAVAVKRLNGDALSAGDIVSGGIYDLAHNGTNYTLLTGFNPSGYISALTALTTPDHAADYIPIYDTSASANKKVLPLYLAPSVRACFSVHKNGTDQTSVSNGTLITFSSNEFDINDYFSSNTWTPPAGTVQMSAGLAAATGDQQLVGLALYKNGAAFKAGTVAQTSNAGVASATVTGAWVDQCNGSDAYTIRYVGTGSVTVSGLAASTFFMGTMV